MAGKRRGLGKNLSDLLSISPESLAEFASNEATDKKKTQQKEHGFQIKYIALDKLKSGKYQPRKDLNLEALEELANSIKKQGLLQPIVVRAITNKQYEIIAGERRWRAAKIAELKEIPAIVRDVSDEVTMAFALIENMQRENLNVVEEAIAIQRLVSDCKLTHQEVADTLGKPRGTISNLLRLLTLHVDVLTMLEHGDIEFGHAKVLLALKNEQQVEAATQVISHGLSVRETEVLVKKIQSPTAKINVEKAIDPDVLNLQKVLTEKVGTKVKIQYNANGKGKIIFNYKNLTELEKILSHIQ
ncbi:MAG: chromosome partitioning protein ParB [Legionellales bacterium]|nr:chromosome partitioning protein ParB [Legionellales bacterium]|tara:strand:- start:471 stop:1373 length:903 start_codon:yes stop_codon:yes gene_type:complete